MIKIKMWEFTSDGCLRGETVRWCHNPNNDGDYATHWAHGTKTIETSHVVGVRGLNGQTIVQTIGGSEYMLDGPSRPDLIREAATPRT